MRLHPTPDAVCHSPDPGFRAVVSIDVEGDSGEYVSGGSHCALGLALFIAVAAHLPHIYSFNVAIIIIIIIPPAVGSKLPRVSSTGGFLPSPVSPAGGRLGRSAFASGMLFPGAGEFRWRCRQHGEWPQKAQTGSTQRVHATGPSYGGACSSGLLARGWLVGRRLHVSFHATGWGPSPPPPPPRPSPEKTNE